MNTNLVFESLKKKVLYESIPFYSLMVFFIATSV